MLQTVPFEQMLRLIISARGRREQHGDAALGAGLMDVIGQITFKGGFRVGVTGRVLGLAVIVAELYEIVIGMRGKAGRPFPSS